MSTRATTISLTGVTKTYDGNRGRTIAVRDVSAEVRFGELVLLLGPSGSGKTTLLTLMAGLIKPTTGEVRLFGREIASYYPGELQRLRARRMGFVFQNFLLLDFLTVLENLVVVLEFGGEAREDCFSRARGLLERFDLAGLAHRFPRNLSQGEKQRVAIARAIANGAILILADEPTASLETQQGRAVIMLLSRLAHEEGRAVVVATHDLRLVEYADRILRMEDGAIMETGPQEPRRAVRLSKKRKRSSAPR